MSQPEIPCEVCAMGGNNLRCEGWKQETILRTLENIMENAERPEQLVIYGGIGECVRSRESCHAIVNSLQELDDDETLVVRSGMQVAVFRTNTMAPWDFMATTNIKKATRQIFCGPQDENLTIFAQYHAAHRKFIGTQYAIQGTFQTLAAIRDQRFGGSLAGRILLTDGMGGHQPSAMTVLGVVCIHADVDAKVVDRRLGVGCCDVRVHDVEDAVRMTTDAASEKRPFDIAPIDNAADVLKKARATGSAPDIVTDMTPAHDPLSCVPAGLTVNEARELRKRPREVLRTGWRFDDRTARNDERVPRRGRSGVRIRQHARKGRPRCRPAGESRDKNPGFVGGYIRPLFCEGRGPFRWTRMSRDPKDLARLDDVIKAMFADDEQITGWNREACKHIPIKGLAARICCLGIGRRKVFGIRVNEMIRTGELKGPVAVSHANLDSGVHFVRGGRHALEAEIRETYCRTMARLSAWFHGVACHQIRTSRRHPTGAAFLPAGRLSTSHGGNSTIHIDNLDNQGTGCDDRCSQPMGETSPSQLNHGRIRMIKRISTMVAAAGIALTAPAYADAIKIGFNVPLTGFAAADGTSALTGAELAVEQINAEGGINGEMLELVVYDDQANPKEAAPLAVKLTTQDEVIAGISGSYSGSTRAAATIFQENSVPYISSYAIHPDITRAGDYVFRTSFVGEVQGRAGAKLVGEMMGARRVSMITLSNDFGKSLAAGFREKAADFYIEILNEYEYSIKDREFGPIVSRVRSDNPEAIYASGYFFTAGPLVRQLRAAGVTVPVIGQEGYDSYKFIEIAGPDAEGVIITTSLDRGSTDPMVVDFMNGFAAKAGYPADMVGASTHTAVLVLAEALRAAGTTDRTAIRDAIAATNLTAVTGDIAFNSLGEVRKNVEVQIVRDGDWHHHSVISDPELLAPPNE